MPFNDLVINFFSEHSLNIIVMAEIVKKNCVFKFVLFFLPDSLHILANLNKTNFFFFYRMSEILCGRIFG